MRTQNLLNMKGCRIMKTYVELKGTDRKFDTIEDAIQEAENQQLETADIEVYSEDGELLESIWQKYTQTT